MARIVRLTESDLNRIVKRVINESQSAQAQQLISNANKLASTGCFSEKTTPKLVALAKALGLGVAAIGAFALTYISMGTIDGISGGLFVTTGLFASAAALDNLVKSIKNNESSYKKELQYLYDCIF